MRLHLLAVAALTVGLTGLSLEPARAAPATAGSAKATPAAAGAVVSEAGRLAIRHEKLTLANGMELILVEDHRLPLVAFNLWVHAGPRNEAKGQTGFAHLFEHLLFAGTKHIPRGEADKIVDAAGGTDSNGSTNFDRTNYYFTLPSNQLELGLWLKSDMLGYMIDEVDAVALANQQDVVRNERRQSLENQPYGIVDEAMFHALYPEGHPYRARVIGSHADIQSIKLADVKAFSRTYYRPNNATLVLAGDFDPKRAKALVQKYFGTLKAGDPVPPVTAAQPKITSERRLVVTDKVELPRLTLAWHTPAIFAAGDADLDVLGHLLGGGKASRLYKKLVYDRQVAQSVEASQYSLTLGSLFSIEIVARPGATLEQIEKLVDEELATLATTPPSTEELDRARAAIEYGLLSRMEKVGTLADLVNHYNQMAGDPDYVGKDLARYRSVSPASVSAAAKAWLGKDARVVVQAIPGEKVLAPEVPTPTAPPVAAAGERESLNADEPWRKAKPKPSRAQALTLPAGKRTVLPNGLTLVHVAKPGLPLVSASLVLRAGQITNPANQPGLSGFTAAMLQEGTSTRSAQQIADQLANLGANLNTGAGNEDARIELSSLKANFAPAMELLADVALNPVFAPAEVERQKAARLAALAQQREQPRAVAAVVANRALYGEAHPLGAGPLGDEAAIRAVDSSALTRYWRAHYRPERAALVVSGDIGEAELRRLATRLFGSWSRAGSGDDAAPPAPAAAPTAARLILVDKPGAPQTALTIVAPGPRAADPAAASARVMNAALGGLFTSRINTQLREVKGYTYGVNSSFAMGREIGAFGIRGSVRTEVTGPALVDLFKEVDGMREKAMAPPELERVRNALLLSLPGQFDTNRAIVGSLANDWTWGLPADNTARLPGRLAAVTAQSALQAAKQHVDPASLIVVAIGDKAKLVPQLEPLKREPSETRDASGALAKPDGKPDAKQP